MVGVLQGPQFQASDLSSPRARSQRRQDQAIGAGQEGQAILERWEFEVEVMTGADIKSGWVFDTKGRYGGECKQQHGSTSFGCSSHKGLKVDSKIFVLAHPSLL